MAGQGNLCELEFEGCDKGDARHRGDRFRKELADDLAPVTWIRLARAEGMHGDLVGFEADHDAEQVARLMVDIDPGSDGILAGNLDGGVRFGEAEALALLLEDLRRYTVFFFHAHGAHRR